MASKPGPLSEWPWKGLGNYKYIVLAPWVAHSVYSYVTSKDEIWERDLTSLLVFPYLLWRWIHGQIWITLARFQTARSKHRILDKGIEFEQVDRERNWDDLIILNGLIFYPMINILPGASNLPIWRTDGVVISFLIHAGPTEFLYYWLHKALHHHYLYSRYHSHHHSSIVTEPITSVVHPFAEHIMYFILFGIPMAVPVLTGTGSIAAMLLYITYVDFMNNLGHCNFELVPKWVFDVFPVLKYIMYTPSFHSLHHTQFRTNLSLFMPLYDYMYGTMDVSSDKLYETSLKGRENKVDVVHLTHPTTLESIYHLRPAIASLASSPYAPKWYLWVFWPITYGCMLLSWIWDTTFTVERHLFDDLKMQTWAIPRYSFQYFLPWQKDKINSLIEKAIVTAEEAGAKVFSLGLLNQGEELNGNGELYLQRNPKLNIRIVDGSSLAVAVILNSIPQGTKEVLLRANLSKVVYAVAEKLCQKGVKVAVVSSNDLKNLKLRLSTELWSNLIFASTCTQKVWLVEAGVLTEDEQKQAPEGTHFIPVSQFPVKRARKDCVYYTTPALVIPKALENVHACENWLPRRVMSAWHVAGVVHALEGWDSHECGDKLLDVEKVWSAAVRHGFRLPIVVHSS
ncbi:protein ECERIFERUM 1-like [Papaver somniferum]|uniref:protein ECERIFERUM 1-like n=1 Tax=Papaver somniferum TaxID=3469 RepID=UPI000E7027A1|nr:protein ECERIFERUM 1-like [Papaver somniferum]